MKKKTIATAFALILTGCNSKPSRLDAEQLLPTDVQRQYDTYSAEAFAATAEVHASCLARATNDVSAKDCEDSAKGQAELSLSAGAVDLYMEYTYKAELEKLWKQHPTSKSEQAELGKKEAGMQKVLLDYDRGRCAMNDHEFHPTTVPSCELNCCDKVAAR
jgi:hypothetical protein